MAAEVTGILLALLTVFVSGFAQICLKKGSRYEGKWFNGKIGIINWLDSYNPFRIINQWTVGGGLIFGVSLVVFIVALRFGDLSTLAPIGALDYVWVGMLSKFFFDEDLSVIKLMGTLVIVFGVLLVIVG